MTRLERVHIFGCLVINISRDTFDYLVCSRPGRMERLCTECTHYGLLI